VNLVEGTYMVNLDLESLYKAVEEALYKKLSFYFDSDQQYSGQFCLRGSRMSPHLLKLC